MTVRLLAGSAAAALIFAVPACQSPTAPVADAKILLHNDFEASAGWSGASDATLTTAQAHSGRWAVQATPELPFSLTYVRTLAQLSAQPTHKLRLEAWARRPAANSTALLVVQVNASATNATQLFYGTLPLAQAAGKLNTWQAVAYPFTLPPTVGPDNVIKIYLWADRATAPTYIDDIKLIRMD